MGRAERQWARTARGGLFGPKGFASLVFGLLVFRSNVAESRFLFEVIAVVVASSIVLHSSSDVLFVRWFRGSEDHPRSTEQA